MRGENRRLVVTDLLTAREVQEQLELLRGYNAGAQRRIDAEFEFINHNDGLIKRAKLALETDPTVVAETRGNDGGIVPVYEDWADDEGKNEEFGRGVRRGIF